MDISSTSNLDTESTDRPEETKLATTPITNHTNKETTSPQQEPQLSNNEAEAGVNERPDQAEEPKNDSSTFSTAFTISFDDEATSSKKLGIKDSIRKFAPPKPHTIEKPRQPKSDRECQDNSLMSIESAPAGGLPPKHHRKSSSSRSSSRRSNSSRHSNVSESASFLIDKMLNCKQTDPEHLTSSLTDQQNNLSHESTEIPRGTGKQPKKSPSSSSRSKRDHKPTRLTHSSDNILDGGELDFGEDRSDNGTYVVGADPESEAARKKIDELFGLVKAAEASVLADSRAKAEKSLARQSRVADKRPLNKERQERINRLACRTSSSVSRSSSSSRPDSQNRTDDGQPKVSSSKNCHLRQSSCDRTSKNQRGSRHRRSVSQSSRQSSNKDISDNDTRSSRSSLHNDIDVASNHESSSRTDYPSMKFNRAFALRRARLGLGEPVRDSGANLNQSAPQYSSQVGYSAQQDQVESVNNMSSSHRRHQINSTTYKANQGGSSSASANFCRDDGGRFSLRMKNKALPSRLSSANHLSGSNRSPQHSALIDSHLSRMSGVKLNQLSALAQGQELAPSQLQQTYQRISSNHQTKLQQSPTSVSSTALPYQSSDELDACASPSRYRHLMNRFTQQQNYQQQQQSRKTYEQESDNDSYQQYSNYSLGADSYQENNEIMHNSTTREDRASSSGAGGRMRASNGSNLQLGALDSLVISAISSLSLKIRQSVCDLMVDHAKKLPHENETRLIVEEILPQITAQSSGTKSPTSIEEIDQSLYFDLAKTLKNLKKVEQMVDVIGLISNQLASAPASSSGGACTSSLNNNNTSSTSSKSTSHRQHNAKGIINRHSDSTTNSDLTSINNLSPV